MDTKNSQPSYHRIKMKHWQQYNTEDRLDLLYITSAAKGLPQLAVEKDWWVMMVLKALSNTHYAEYYSFKGGTSLSKGWQLIDRFSEDIDIALKREGKFAISSTSNNQIAKVRRIARHYIIRDLPQELKEQLSLMGITDFVIEPITHLDKEGQSVELRATTHPSVILVKYKSVLPDISEYIQPQVKIEISCLSMDEPVEKKAMQSFIAQEVPGAENVIVEFNTVLPTRTFLEKLMLLHEEFQKENPRTKRMSRHLYDILRIMNSPFGVDAVNDCELYNEIVKHRSIFNRLDCVDYSTLNKQTIKFIPPQNVIDEYRDDYNTMLNHFMHNTSGNPDFETLIERLTGLNQKINTLK